MTNIVFSNYLTQVQAWGPGFLAYSLALELVPGVE